jgi:multisubunit Na+/H+ antiporter MnhC subunit
MQTAAAKPRESWWWIPALVAALAIPTFVAFWIGGRPEAGLLWASLSVVFALVLAFGGRSETIRLIRGQDDDERAMALELQAAMLTAAVLTMALAALFLVTAARGENPIVYGLLLLLAETTHLGALAVLNRRS